MDQDRSLTRLFLVPTPIGNLKDITLRALEVLKEVDVILAEDTRVTKKLLHHYEISTPIRSLHMHNEHKIVEGLVQEMRAGKTFAQVSDAGTPGISDPGFLLAREAIKENVQIECLPGASAIIPALVISGLPSDRFVFEGFVPQKKGRQTKLKLFAAEERTVVFYESPHRIHKCLVQLREFCEPERQVAVCRELTKLHEEAIRGTLDEVIAQLENGVKGECVVVLSGSSYSSK